MTLVRTSADISFVFRYVGAMIQSLVACRKIAIQIALCRLFFGMLSLVVPPIVAVESMPRVIGPVGPRRYSKSDVRCAITACVASTLVRSSAPRVDECTWRPEKERQSTTASHMYWNQP